MPNRIVDQMGMGLEFSGYPSRIVSLVPSQTELLFDLGLDANIVAVTRFCIHPGEKIAHKAKIGGTKNFNVGKIKELAPDLIIGNKEENYEEGIAELKRYFPVWMSDIHTLADAYEMMTAIGEITNTQMKAEAIVNEVKSSFMTFSAAVHSSPFPSCAYFIWRKPYMVAASGTFIDHMLSVFGVKNVFEDLSRYPEVTAEQIASKAPDLIFLSSEPYAFTDKHIAEFRGICPDSRIIIADGELFSWYGSRLKYTAAYFEDMRRQIFT